MDAINTRLIIEAVVMTMALIALGTVSFWAYVQAQRRTPDAIRELTGSNDELAQRVRTLERNSTANYTALLRLQTRLEMQNTYSRALADYSRMLADRLRGLGVVDIPAAPRPPADLGELMTTTAPIDGRVLTQTIAALFDRDEIDDLAFRLGIKPDEIAGETINKRTRALVTYAERHGLTEELVTLARQLRPEGKI